MKQSIDILYYSNALIAGHGGKLHSEAFIKEAQKNEITNNLICFPRPSGEVATGNSWFRKKLKKIPLLQVCFFYRRNHKSYKEIISTLEKTQVDCLHIRLDSNFLIIGKLKKRFPELLITTEVNASPFDENFSNIPFKKFFKNLEQKCLQKADANFFVSGFLRKKIIKDILSNRDFVVHNGVDLELFEDGQSIKNKENITFGYVGTLDFHKNLNILFDAFQQVQKIHPGAKLLLVGDGPMYPELRKYVKKKKLSNSIRFVGRVPHKEINTYLKKMDIAIHHSANPYMSPLKIFEYLAAGLPVIGPDIPAVREIFKNGQDIILVKKNKEDIAEKMQFLLENEQKREYLSTNGREKVVANFGWNKNAEKILTVLQEKCTKKVNFSNSFEKKELSCPV